MGCASSGSAKTATDSIMEFTNKEAKAVQEFGTATKDTIMSGVDHVNDMVGSALDTAENEVKHVAEKTTNFFSHTGDSIKNLVKGEDDHHESENTNNTSQDISETETVIMTENENHHESHSAMESEEESPSKKSVQEVSNSKEDILEIEDIEQLDHLGEKLDHSQEKPKEILNSVSNTVHDILPTKTEKEE